MPYDPQVGAMFGAQQAMPQQSAPPDVLALILEQMGRQQQFNPVDAINAQGAWAQRLLPQIQTPKQTSPWADTMSPERRAMYGRVSQNALGSAENPYSWDRTNDVQRWAAGPTPIQNQQWLNRQAPQVFSPAMPSIDMWNPNAQVQNRVMPNPTTQQLQQMNPPRMDAGYINPAPLGLGFPSMPYSGLRPNYWGI